jgi:signal transduction histidine kinase
MIDRFGLDEPSIGMGLEELWERVQAAFGRIVKSLSMESAVLFHSDYQDSSQMKLCAFYPPTMRPPALFSLASYQEFEWLEAEGWVGLPKEDGYFDWLIPETLLGVKHGVLFGRELVGHLTMIGFGLKTTTLGSIERRALQDAVARIFRFLTTGLAAAELDHLMTETGHLMGRAMGKVISGVQALQDTLTIPPPESDDSGLIRLALWAIEDGQIRLEPIRQNFYSFQSRRRQSSDLGEQSYLESFDALREVEKMRNHFDRAVVESRLKPIAWDLRSAGSFSLTGDRNAFRLMLLNIFDNALKFSYTNTYITIVVESDGVQCRISCSNLGIGVAGDEVSNVFQPLFKSRYRDPVRRSEGLGLGLPYCRWVAEEVFGGKINLTSSEARVSSPRRFEGDNWITTITVILPLRRVESSDAD